MRSATCIIAEVVFYERDVRLRLPFRFGVVTLTAAPQLFVQVRIEMPSGASAWGSAAELLAPKWFDKNLALSNEDNFAQLRDVAETAARTYVDDRVARTAFERFHVHYAPHLEACERRGHNRLLASFGPALIDRAILDALCRLHDCSFYDAVRGDLPEIDPSGIAPDLASFDMPRFLAMLSPRMQIAARHTVGLVDPITAEDVGTPIDDGLPETLEAVVATYGHRHFKIKVGGDTRADLDRLTRIAAVLDRIEAPYIATLDGNEQYQDVEAIVELWRKVGAEPRLARLKTSTLFIEQPIARGVALHQSIEPLARHIPVLVDESDADLDAFVQARALGYAGVSSKACKGFYKSLINAARCTAWNDNEPAHRYFMSGEDLTCQAGLAVQQDLALVSLLGLDHVERNGHHYVNGLADCSATEQAAFLHAHPDLYERRDGTTRLRIADGKLTIGTLGCVGFASAATPDWSRMRRLSVIARA